MPAGVLGTHRIKKLESTLAVSKEKEKQSVILRITRVLAKAAIEYNYLSSFRRPSPIPDRYTQYAVWLNTLKLLESVFQLQLSNQLFFIVAEIDGE